jgi:hypothetical protein
MCEIVEAKMSGAIRNRIGVKSGDYLGPAASEITFHRTIFQR